MTRIGMKLMQKSVGSVSVRIFFHPSDGKGALMEKHSMGFAYIEYGEMLRICRHFNVVLRLFFTICQSRILNKNDRLFWQKQLFF